MKKREGFISNSSTTSFVCRYCNKLKEIWEGDAPYFNGLGECKNHHVICREHFKIDFHDIKYIEDKIKRELPDENLDFESAPGEFAQDEYQYFLQKIIADKYDDGHKFYIEEEYCPVCSDKDYKLSVSDVMAYLNKKNPELIDSLKKEIKEKYETYAAFEADNFTVVKHENHDGDDNEWPPYFC